MIVFFISFNFSVNQLATQRDKFKHKICFKPHTQHLRNKTSPVIAITSRLYRDGNFLRLYKLVNKFFLNVLLKKIYQLPHNNEFKNFFLQYQSFKDFNRVLYWKITTINSLFNLKKLKKKKLLYYLQPERRVVLILLWLKNIIKLQKMDRKNLSYKLIKPLLTFVFQNKGNNQVNNIKLKIYKLRVLRG